MPTNEPETFGSYIRRIREARNLSLRQAAAIIPMNYTYLFAVEKGPEIPSGEKIQKMVKAYSMSVSSLMHLLPTNRQADVIAADTQFFNLLRDFYCLLKTTTTTKALKAIKLAMETCK